MLTLEKVRILPFGMFVLSLLTDLEHVGYLFRNKTLSNNWMLI